MPVRIGQRTLACSRARPADTLPPSGRSALQKLRDLNTAVQSSALVPFRWPDFRRLFVAAACSTLASRGLAVVLGYEVYELTKSPLSLGILGLVEAIPALSLALYGGHVADRTDRRRILRRTLGALVVCAAILALLETTNLGKAQLVMLYAVVFLAGIARGFAEPAAAALEAQSCRGNC